MRFYKVHGCTVRNMAGLWATYYGRKSMMAGCRVWIPR